MLPKVRMETSQGWRGGGRQRKSPVHINGLELHAAKLTLMAVAPSMSDFSSQIDVRQYHCSLPIFDKMGGFTLPGL